MLDNVKQVPQSFLFQLHFFFLLISTFVRLLMVLITPSCVSADRENSSLWLLKEEAWKKKKTEYE